MITADRVSLPPSLAQGGPIRLPIRRRSVIQPEQPFDRGLYFDSVVEIGFLERDPAQLVAQQFNRFQCQLPHICRAAD